jgi:predicted  nucleic acid-binding Zn-ribbon protein
MKRLPIVLAVAGWGLCGFLFLESHSGSETRAEIERLTQQVQKAEADRDALAAELEPLKNAHQDLQHLEKRIASAAEEVKHLEYLRGRVSGEIDAIRP